LYVYSSILPITLLGINHLLIGMPLITALMMVYDFHPNSTTLEEEHLNPEMMAMTPRRKSPPPIPERLLWSYITQIANAIKAIHSSGMALRGLDPSRIILTGKNRYVLTLVMWVRADDRIRLTGVGILDVVSYDPHVHISGLQVRHPLHLAEMD
jgi:PAB-dependent poly(A)-specific ribonuclease subunit 3